MASSPLITNPNVLPSLCRVTSTVFRKIPEPCTAGKKKMNVSANTQVKTRADHSREYSAVAYFFAFFDSSRYIKVSAVSILPNITAHSSAINAIEK